MLKITKKEEYQFFPKNEGLISTNNAVNHLNGTLTDETLIVMSDEELEQLAYGDVENKDFIRTEMYKRTSDKKKADKQGDYFDRSGVYEGIHRAKLLLFKREKEYENTKRSVDNSK